MSQIKKYRKKNTSSIYQKGKEKQIKQQANKKIKCFKYLDLNLQKQLKISQSKTHKLFLSSKSIRKKNEQKISNNKKSIMNQKILNVNQVKISKKIFVLIK
ncbi:hypothetical protein TTHERM_000506959 (macronuclear) [Tetrahymena thermophila SB210]|uniref:Uncharacterized protein n=1 Tax=Tetrahymena thermophila (strain SB210) TaxID=312017 RepID=W7XK24_TETTS|nr:hypothetical protein TTHERM_000506959 [Tetrahymena thermophila SB210]EWS74534.1 hypothetical protein TTHERM_000506959 [Tetrahymena thermophila SB210]|eukprot:XP_012652908.1 hypothetical protein TTHERM_000506959 [Tetrahymena thermophila SB210]